MYEAAFLAELGHPGGALFLGRDMGRRTTSIASFSAQMALMTWMRAVLMAMIGVHLSS